MATCDPAPRLQEVACSGPVEADQVSANNARDCLSFCVWARRYPRCLTVIGPGESRTRMLLRLTCTFQEGRRWVVVAEQHGRWPRDEEQAVNRWVSKRAPRTSREDQNIRSCGEEISTRLKTTAIHRWSSGRSFETRRTQLQPLDTKLPVDGLILYPSLSFRKSTSARQCSPTDRKRMSADMAFKSSSNERLNELGLASPRSSLSESPFSSFPSPPAGQTSFNSTIGTDIRSTIQRRFTTDSTKISPWMGFGPQPVPLPESIDILSSATRMHKSQLFEKKRQHIEYMREQKKRFEADLKLLNLQQEKEEEEMDQIARDLARTGLGGPVSEPTTPPEYHDSGFPTALSRPARFSISNGQSTPGRFNNFFSPQLTSPASKASSPFGLNNSESITSSMNSRRNSENEFQANGFGAYRPRHMSRYSMSNSTFQSSAQSTASNTSSFSNSLGFGAFYTGKHSVDEDENKHREEERMSTPDVKSYLRLTDPDDKFPTLTRRNDDPNVLSANSAALDLANSRTPVPEAYRPNQRHHSAHQSMPQTAFGWLHSENSSDKAHIPTTSPGLSNGNYHPRHISRLSLEGGFSGYSSSATGNTPSHSRPTSLQISYSTNDVPTMRNGGFPTNITPPGSSSDHHMNGGINSLSHNPHQLNDTPPTPQSDHSDPISSMQSGFQATAAPFSSQIKTPATMSTNVSGSASPAKNNFPHTGYGYGMQPWVTSPVQTNGMPLANHPPFAQPFPAYPRFLDNPARVNQIRRNGETEVGAFSRFANVPLEQYRDELYGLCKDQHGCRYLQRKLEERIPENVQMIFLETHMHVVELMTDPFGNYLCQKLLEFSNDEQRTALINNAAPQLVSIALNQHGTRALQKMIEFISTPEQTQTVINALRGKVVELVQDLNGNHVIQKCLNRLSVADAQDPFGNYVVQYILDLAEPHFTEPLCQTFVGKVSMLSKQKFSSNVIEKCPRTAEFQSRRLLIQEMLPAQELERMLRDSFANYVVQTAMDYADPETRVALIEAIRPILPAIRQTPHGRRIAGKIMSIDSQNRTNGTTNGQLTPNGRDENGIYHQGNAFSSPTISQYGPQFTTNISDNLGGNSSMTVMTGDPSISGSTVPTTDSTTTIFCPVPQQGASVLNGINGATQGFSLY
ncbi:conserved hypothetical protein [Uncinocarpus reesii 1704]|uniref:PUM-HD domain-containing protein n=1 Tax=Uncinocarpus reesii (strain UAMH 1704) TaxID=336963 RepID=C4JMP1_UNCRE|nr:uncharacterized protein UREG_04099 [Uncinocarpus reesii 1704]EEP79253.1 conserved hypothetical protein [Uncinocarpus reesii 1704]